MQRIGYLAGLTALVLALSACSSDSSGGVPPGGSAGSANGCTAGDQKNCDCIGGTVKGVQVCKQDGSGWDVCSGCGTGSPCGECDGCCKGTTCTKMANEASASCGPKGTSCKDCGTGYACAMGTCVIDTGQCSPASCSSGCCSGNICIDAYMQDSFSCGKNGGSCTQCSMYGMTCASGSCSDAMNPYAYFSIKVLDVKVQEHDSNGDAWDANGGLPDLYVCMGISGKSACTVACSDSTSCTYNSATGGVLGGSSPLVFSGAELQNLGISVYDEDLTSDDLVGSGTFTLSQIQTSYSTLPFDGVIVIDFVLY